LRKSRSLQSWESEGKWEVGSGKWKVGSGKWNAELDVCSNRREVGSGKWEVGSGFGEKW